MRVLKLLSTVLGALTGCSSSASTNPDALVERAAERGVQGDLKGSIAVLDDALRIDPRHATAYATRATAFRKLGNYQRAVQDCSKAIEINPRFAEAYCQRALAYQQSQLDNRVEHALADASKAIDLDQTNPLAFIVRGNARLERKEYPQAIADFTKAIELNPRSYSAYGNRARAYSARGEVVKARADIEKALALNPPNADELSLRAVRKMLEKQP
jgi:tetratricopeptide (TPR) repeat protein